MAHNKFGWDLPPGTTMKDIDDHFAEPEMPANLYPLFSAFCEAVDNEVIRARHNNFEPFHSMHEGYAVIFEELLEVRQLVFMPSKERRAIHPDDLKAQIIKECTQVAAMCFCMIAECLPGVTSDDIAGVE